MCETCGCGDPELVPVDVQEGLLAENDRVAAHNRDHFESVGVTVVNLMGSPGSGKTALLEATARQAPELRMSALNGDLATDRDAHRLRRAGIPCGSITTGSACHLDARLVHRSLPDVPWEGSDILFIENVGNLVCPALYDLGQRANVVVLSVTEGVDKPLKYPTVFRAAELVVLTKIDLLPHLPGVSIDAIWQSLARTVPEPRIIPVSAVTGRGLATWLGWLDDLRRAGREEEVGAAVETLETLA